VDPERTQQHVDRAPGLGRWCGIGAVAGDAEREAQADLLADHRDRLQADVLIVPHHGSRTSDAEFLRATEAAVAVISVGAGNRHGHPAKEIVEVLESAGMEVRRTDREGPVRIELPSDLPPRLRDGSAG
jgi:beta-lactamase superfamily II metal-dependent hydrolase